MPASTSGTERKSSGEGSRGSRREKEGEDLRQGVGGGAGAGAPGGLERPRHQGLHHLPLQHRLRSCSGCHVSTRHDAVSNQDDPGPFRSSLLYFPKIHPKDRPTTLKQGKIDYCVLMPAFGKHVNSGRSSNAWARSIERKRILSDLREQRLASALEVTAARGPDLVSESR